MTTANNDASKKEEVTPLYIYRSYPKKLFIINTIGFELLLFYISLYAVPNWNAVYLIWAFAIGYFVWKIMTYLYARKDRIEFYADRFSIHYQEIKMKDSGYVSERNIVKEIPYSQIKHYTEKGFAFGKMITDFRGEGDTILLRISKTSRIKTLGDMRLDEWLKTKISSC